MKTILLKFAGPLQSWGSNSNFENRYTDYYPSKSAVIGLIAAALGYRKANDKEIVKLNNLDFAVRIDQRGNLLKDYQIARSYKKEKIEVDKTYVTSRYYLEDAVFVVALSGDSDMVDKLLDALNTPYFQLSLGRRSVPPTADFILGAEEGNAIDLLENLPWQAADWYIKKSKKKWLI